jgi:uncharacterized protein YcbK (DUF882 family)
VVKPGESVAKIADFYGVSQRDLREMNKLRKDRPLKVGQQLRIPNVLRVDGKRYKVKAGDTLASIAQKHGCEVRDLKNANKLKNDGGLQVGRTLVIPDGGRSAKSINTKEGSPQPVVFLRVATGEREKLRLYNKRGEMIYAGVRRLSYLARDKRGKQRVKRLHFRLVKMLQQVADQFPDTPIEIISGYRPQEKSGQESQHAFGRAMDFRMPGVSGKAIYQFCRTLPRSGCGYYPKDGFVHMDARERKAHWVGK